jgi:hypothetical protein
MLQPSDTINIRAEEKKGIDFVRRRSQSIELLPNKGQVKWRV